MKMSQNQIKELSEIYSERMPQKVFDLMVELQEHQWDGGKLTNEQYNSIIQENKKNACV